MTGARRVGRDDAFSRCRKPRAGVTLIEILVAVTILFILMTIIFSIIQITSQAWKKTSQTTTSMQQARVAFERMTRNLSQATLNTYYSYYYASGATSPSYYMRQSELQFISGNGPIGTSSFISGSVGNVAQITHALFFQAPLGMVNSSDAANYGQLSNLLNACGYFVTYSLDPLRPAFLNSMSNKPQNEYRYRLMEMLQPSENLGVYTQGAIPAAGGSVPTWISNSIPDLTQSETSTGTITVRPLANNIVALIVMPEQYSSSTTNGQVNTAPIYSTTTSTYNYDSAYNASVVTTGTQTLTGNQLPPLVKIIMVSIDEASAIKLAALNPGAGSSSPPNLGQSSLFTDPTKLYTSGGVKGDLDKFEDVLNAVPGNIAGNAIKLNYYVFQTDVLIRGAKWTNS